MSAGLLEDTRLFVDKYREKLRELKFEDLDVKELKEVGAIIKQIPALAKDLDEAERTLSKDIIAEAKARGSQTKSLLEDED